MNNEQTNLTQEYGTDVERLRSEIDAWRETARKYAENAEYHKKKRYALLKWLRDTGKTYVDIAPLVPEEFKDDFFLIELKD